MRLRRPVHGARLGEHVDDMAAPTRETVPTRTAASIVISVRDAAPGRSRACGLLAALMLVGAALFGRAESREGHSLSLTPVPYYVRKTWSLRGTRRPHIGHAYTTIACRHPRAALPAARGGHVLHVTGVDEHGTSKVARVAAEQGLTAKEFADSIVGAWQEVPRRRRSHHMTSSFARPTRATRRSSPSFLPADPRRRRHLRGRLCRLLLRRLRGVQDRVRASGREVPSARHRARVDRGEELVLPALGVSRSTSAPSSTSGRTSCCRASGTTRHGAS